MISVVIVNWNAGSRLLDCVTSALAGGADEVVVVDNASTDGSADALQKSPRVRLVANGSNRGLAAAMNQGAIASEGDVIVFSNPDVVFPAGGVAALAATLGRHARAGAVVPRSRFADGGLQTTAGQLPSLREALEGRQRQWRESKWGSAEGFCWDGWPHDEEREVGRAGDVCFAVSRDALAQTGLFDERFPLDWETIDWSERLRRAGWEIWFTPSVEVAHHAGTSTGQAPVTRWVASTHTGMYRYFAKRAPAVARPALAVMFAARALAKLALMRGGVPLREMAQRPRAKP